MGIDNLTCYGCGSKGHLERNCTNAEIDATGKPPWCGICDERARLTGCDRPARCQQCHPLRHRQLQQHRKCPACHMTVHEWDVNPCGGHSSPITTADNRPEREHIDRIIAAGRNP